MMHNAARYSTIRHFALVTLAALVGCSGCTARRVDPAALVPVHYGAIHPDVRAALDIALDLPHETVWQVTAIEWEAAASGALDSLAYVTGIVRCPTEQASRYSVKRTRCPDMTAPWIHTHLDASSCSPSRTDFVTQVQLGHAFDVVYCGKNGGSHFYFIAQNPIVVARLLARGR